MVVVSPGWLNVSIVEVDPQIGGAVNDAFIVPVCLPIVMPIFGGEWVERNSIYGNAKILMLQGGRLRRNFRVSWNFKVVALRANRVWVTSIRKCAGCVIGNPV